MFCGWRALVLQPKSFYTFSDLEFGINHFGILDFGYLLETVAGVGWESTILATFCTSPVPCSSRIVHILGDLSSDNQITWVSEFCPEILVPL